MMRGLFVTICLLFVSFSLFAQSEREQRIREYYEIGIRAKENYINHCVSEINSAVNLRNGGYISEELYQQNRYTWEGELHKTERELEEWKNKMQAELNQVRQDEYKKKVQQQAREAQQRAQQQRAQQAQQARQEQIRRTQQQRAAQAQRAQELEAIRAANEQKRIQQELEREMKRQNDFNDAMRRTSGEYAGKKAEAARMASTGTLNTMQGNMSRSRLKMSISDVAVVPPTNQVSSSSAIEKIKNRNKGNEDKNALKDDKKPFFDEASLLAISTINKGKKQSSFEDNWPYNSRIPFTQRQREPLYSYDDNYEYHLPPIPIETQPIAYNSWGDLQKDSRLTKDQIALFQGSMMIANNGKLPRFVKEHPNGILEFGDDNNCFVISADRQWFEYVKLSSHDYKEDNVVKRLIDDKDIVSADVELGLPKGVSISGRTGTVSKGKTYYEDVSNNPDNSEIVGEKKGKTILGVKGKLEVPIADNSSTLTRGWGYVFNNHMVGFEYAISGGMKAKAGLSGELALSSDSPSILGKAPKASLSATAQVEGYSGQARIIWNTVKRAEIGYVTTSSDLGGKFSAGLFAKKKISNSEIEAGLGPASVKGFLTSKAVGFKKLGK